ncbi:DUF4326 domain-containing protein [Streptomyces sp. PA03-6a]|nr:DUF4326 domain-containing protein [Streptomyces sp. PA03-6a]
MSEGDRAEVEKFRAYLAERKSPKRIQRRRVKGWRKPDNCVVVSRPSRFGNPFTIKDAIAAEMTDPRSAVTQFYSEWLRVGTEGHWYQETYRIGRQVFDRRRILADLHLLRGKDLACTCPLPEPGQPDHCHAAVLLQLANPTKEAQR